MSDHDHATDPVDRAYIQSEALLDDEAARAARRARLLAAVAQPEPVSGAPASRERTHWRRGGWLAAACVAGFGVFLAAHVYQPLQPASSPATPARPAAESAAAPSSAAPAPADLTSPQQPMAQAKPVRPPMQPHIARSTPVAAQAPVEAFAPLSVPPPPAPPPPPPPPPPPQSAPVNAMATADLAPAPPPAGARPGDSVGEVVVTGSRIARDNYAGTRSEWASKSSASPLADVAPDPAARLRAAAAAGRVAELEAILAEGVDVDAADSRGSSALMKSVQADQPAAAALLRRHGASLDRKDRSGRSARDMAKSKHDPELDEALGLDAGSAGAKIGSQ